MKKLIVTDRDGVINYDSEDFIKSPDEWNPIDTSIEAINALNAKGYEVAVATNQSGVAKGYYSLDILDDIHKKMHDVVLSGNGKISHIFLCPHGPTDDCKCRKPLPGLLHQAFEHFKVEPKNVYFVGDSLRDLTAAIAAGCKPVLVLTGNGKKTLSEIANKDEFKNVKVYTNLLDFALREV